MSFENSNPNYEQDEIKERFLELYDLEELKKITLELLPKSSLFKKLLKIDEIEDINKILEIFMQFIGKSFLIKFPYSDDGHHLLRKSLIEQVSKKYNIPIEQIIQKFISTHSKIKKEATLDEISKHAPFSTEKWNQYFISEILRLPLSIIQVETEKQLPETIPLAKNRRLHSLHDYQFQAATKIISLLSNKNESRKGMLFNLPTGAGKTRLTMEAIIEFLNQRDLGYLSEIHEQQKKGRIIFWFASTNELCDQASNEFEVIFSKIGLADTINVTRLYGEKRRKLKDILNEFEGTHFVVTNTHHFRDELSLVHNREHEGKSYLIDFMPNDPYFQYIAKETIAVIIDEAHECTSRSYQRFLAALGFDNSPRKESKSNFSRNNIILIGLTATAYKGSGINEVFECQDCEKVFYNILELRKHCEKNGHMSNDEGDDEDPEDKKKFSANTRKIWKTFQGKPYVPLPDRKKSISAPVAVIDGPSNCKKGEYVKFSGLNSFDRSSDITYEWELRNFDGIKPLIKNEPFFTHKFEVSGTYFLTLTVKTTNNDFQQNDRRVLKINVEDSDNNFSGSIDDVEEFYNILTEKKILCPIIHGVINGPHLKLEKVDIENIKKSGYSSNTNKEIMDDINYNKNILNIVKECINLGRNKILIFANSVQHSNELSILLKIKYGIKSSVVNSNTRPGTRRKIISDFKNGSYQVLINFGVLTTGFDVPKIDTVIISRVVLSNSLMTQMIGRGQRGIVSNGTEDLWLITSHFPQTGSIPEVKLGWEVNAESWGTFPEDVKNILGLEDFKFNKVDTKAIKNNKIQKKIQHKNESGKIFYRCMQCDREVGKEHILEFFDLADYISNEVSKEEKINKVILWLAERYETRDKKITSKFRYLTHGGICITCRKINKIMENVNCEFTENFYKNHNYQSESIEIALHALMGRKKIHFNEIKKSAYFRSSNVIKKFDKILYDIENSFLIFKEIKEDDKLIEIVDLIEHDKFFEKKIEHKPTKSDIKLNLENSILILESILGHLPTEREFKEIMSGSEIYEQFINECGENYKIILSRNDIIIEDDVNLQNFLLSEYFEIFFKLKRKPVPTEIDQYGHFRRQDYVDVFGSFSEFFNLVQPIINKFNQKEDDDAKINEILKDYNEISTSYKLQKISIKDIITYSKIPNKYMNTKIPLYLIPILSETYQKYDEEDLEKVIRIFQKYVMIQNELILFPENNIFKKILTEDEEKIFNKYFHGESHQIRITLYEIINDENLEKIKLIYKNNLWKLLENITKSEQGKSKILEIIELIDSNKKVLELDRETLELTLKIMYYYPSTNELNNLL